MAVLKSSKLECHHEDLDSGSYVPLGPASPVSTIDFGGNNLKKKEKEEKEKTYCAFDTSCHPHLHFALLSFCDQTLRYILSILLTARKTAGILNSSPSPILSIFHLLRLLLSGNTTSVLQLTLESCLNQSPDCYLSRLTTTTSVTLSLSLLNLIISLLAPAPRSFDPAGAVGLFALTD
ncbi:hypothetical protein BDV12DRAFT_1617 [Aspergillus spectabilis]